MFEPEKDILHEYNVGWAKSAACPPSVLIQGGHASLYAHPTIYFYNDECWNIASLLHFLPTHALQGFDGYN
jgi:hypothetical protein